MKIKYTDIGKEVEFSDDKDFKQSYAAELIDIEQIEDETWYRCKQGIWAYCRHSQTTKEIIKKLLELIDKEAKKAGSYDYGLPLHDEREELLVFKVEEFLKDKHLLGENNDQ